MALNTAAVITHLKSLIKPLILSSSLKGDWSWKNLRRRCVKGDSSLLTSELRSQLFPWFPAKRGKPSAIVRDGFQWCNIWRLHRFKRKILSLTQSLAQKSRPKTSPAASITDPESSAPLQGTSVRHAMETRQQQQLVLEQNRRIWIDHGVSVTAAIFFSFLIRTLAALFSCTLNLRICLCTHAKPCRGFSYLSFSTSLTSESTRSVSQRNRFHECVTYVSMRRQGFDLGLVNQICQDNSDGSSTSENQNRRSVEREKPPGWETCLPQSPLYSDPF